MSPDELKKSAENVEAGGQPAQLYDIAGQNPGSGDAERILGVIQRRDDMAWFFKMTGDADLVEQQKPAFVAFLKSLKFAAAQAQTELPPSHPAIGDMGMGAPATAAGPISSEGKPNWQVPAGWQEVSGGQFLVAKFTLTGEGGATAAVNVSIPPATAAAAGEFEPLARTAWFGAADKGNTCRTLARRERIFRRLAFDSLIMTGTDSKTGQPARLVGSIVQQNGQTWFYKLMGDAKVVESQKAAFTKFVQGAKYQDEMTKS